MYYLYRHIRLDKQEVFYIGIGTRGDFTTKLGKERSHLSIYRRAYDTKKSRSQRWINIYNKTEYEIEIMLESESIEFIKNKEIEFIKLYRNTLVNYTAGGGGITSYRHTEESKKKIGIASKNMIRSSEYIAKISAWKNKAIILYTDTYCIKFNSIKEAAIYVGDASYNANIAAVAHGRRKTAYGLKFKFYNKKDYE